MKMQNIFYVLEDSIKNHGVFDTHDFSWTPCNSGEVDRRKMKKGLGAKCLPRGWKMSYNKRGQVGEGILMIYRLLVVTIVAFIIFGVSSVFYDYDIDVRDAEARLLGREIFDCLAPMGVLNLDNIPEDEFGSIISYCGLSGSERFYVGVDVQDSSGKKIVGLYEGDSGAVWISEIYGKAIITGKAIVAGTNLNGEGIGKYNPGHVKDEYPVFVLRDGKKIEGKIKMEVLVTYEN